MRIKCKISVLRTVKSPCLADLAVISSKFPHSLSGVGILAIIGPVNLDYQQLINQVNVVNRFDYEVDRILPLPQQ